jgi:hypothetical protein
MGTKAVDGEMRRARGAWEGLALLALLASPTLYIVSFFLVVFDEPRRPVRGYSVFVSTFFYPLIYGLFALAARDARGLLFLVLCAPWWANVVYGLAVHRLLDGRGGCVALADRAVLLALLALAIPLLINLPAPPERRPFVFHEGYWCWLGSMALFALGGRALGVDRRRKARAEEVAWYGDD